MFYSHEVLTSRKYGVATVWLVATLGAKSTLKKVSRRAILEVDVVKACETIENPGAPMALRLQANLLYGVTRVYNRQCDYTLSDAEQTQNSFRAISRALRTSDLEVDGTNKGRTEQLLLPDDPDFIPDFVLIDVNLSTSSFDQAAAAGHQRRIASGGSSPKSKAQGTSDFEGGLDIPGSMSPFSHASTDRTSARLKADGRTAAILEDDSGLEVAPDGTIIDTENQQKGIVRRADLDRKTSATPLPEAPDSNMVLHAHTDAQRVHDDYGVLTLDDIVSQARPQCSESSPMVEFRHEITSDLVLAPISRRKLLPLDKVTELRNVDIAQWNTNYALNMLDAIRERRTNHAGAQAKKNAAIWMLEPSDGSPLSMFTGARLLGTFSQSQTLAGRAIKRAAEEFFTIPSKRVHADTEELGQATDDVLGFDEDIGQALDETVEQGREQPTPLDDQRFSSSHPWNRSAGSRGPTTARNNHQGNVHLSSVSGSAGTVQPGWFGRRGSHLASLSPLVGRSEPLSGGYGDDGLRLSLHDDLDATLDAAFELSESVAENDAMMADQDHLSHVTLDSESSAFLSFVRESVTTIQQQQQELLADTDRADENEAQIGFDLLLPLGSTSKLTAAQGLLHVLSLATRGFLEAVQDDAFGAIRLKILVC